MTTTNNFDTHWEEFTAKTPSLWTDQDRRLCSIFYSLGVTDARKRVLDAVNPLVDKMDGNP